MECQVCCEVFDDVIECGFCKYKFCKVCSETFLLSSLNYMECMSCKREFTRHMIVNMFDKKFLEKYKNYYSGVLLDFQKSHIPGIIQEHNKKNKIIDCNKRYNKQAVAQQALHLDITYLNQKIIKNYSEKLMNELLNKTKEHILGEIELNKIGKEYNKLKNEITSPVSLYICQHCQKYCDDNGFCVNCNINHCNECLNIKNQNHECNKDDLESVKLIHSQTKQCPGCNIPIFKQNGCNLMFCTSCYTVFSWSTGKVTNPRVMHNPHYIEMMNKRRLETVTEERIVLCGREIDQHFLTRLGKLNHNNNNNSIVLTLIDYAKSIQYMPTYRRKYIKTYNDRKYLEKFILKEIDEKMYKSNLFKNFKDRKVSNDYIQIIDTYMTSATDIIYRFYEDAQKGIYDEMYLEELECLIKLINKEFEILSSDYKICQKEISKTSYLIMTKKK